MQFAVEHRLAPVSSRQASAAAPLKSILLLAALLAFGPAWAGRPLVTEDAGTLARGECEWESFAGRQARPKVTLGASQVGCGVGYNTQLALGVSRDVSDGNGSNYLLVNGKTAFDAVDEASPHFAVAYSLLGGREQTDFMNYETAEVKGVMTLPYRGWLLHANAGLLHLHQDRANRVIWAFAAERPAAIGNIDLMAEVYGDDKNSPWVQAAARWTAIPGRLFIDASYGVHTDGRHARLATLGMKLAF